MKTITQIKNKMEKFKKKLSQKDVYENFGDKEQMLLFDFIGSIWEYPYEERKSVKAIENEFFNWCINYTGKGR